jgi:sulfur carrier protein
MVIKINGKIEKVEKALDLSELILEKGLSADRIVVEHNFRIILKEDLGGIRLKENDSIEIVSFVGGG